MSPPPLSSSHTILSAELCSLVAHFLDSLDFFDLFDLLGGSICNGSLELHQTEENLPGAKQGCNFLVMPDPPRMHRVTNKF